MSAPAGFVRILCKAGTDCILGATVVAADAGNIISEITLAIETNTGLSAIAAVIHPYAAHHVVTALLLLLYHHCFVVTALLSLLCCHCSVVAAVLSLLCCHCSAVTALLSLLCCHCSVVAAQDLATVPALAEQFCLCLRLSGLWCSQHICYHVPAACTVQPLLLLMLLYRSSHKQRSLLLALKVHFDQVMLSSGWHAYRDCSSLVGLGTPPRQRPYGSVATSTIRLACLR